MRAAPSAAFWSPLTLFASSGLCSWDDYLVGRTYTITSYKLQRAISHSKLSKNVPPNPPYLFTMFGDMWTWTSTCRAGAEIRVKPTHHGGDISPTFRRDLGPTTLESYNEYHKYVPNDFGSSWSPTGDVWHLCVRIIENHENQHQTQIINKPCTHTTI